MGSVKAARLKLLSSVSVPKFLRQIKFAAFSEINQKPPKPVRFG